MISILLCVDCGALSLKIASAVGFGLVATVRAQMASGA